MPEIAVLLLAWYGRFGRGGLPWRRSRDPYAIVVAEFMLQQTQVDRVIPHFERFLARFPSFAALAAAPQSEIVRDWKGLGYNSRAVRLHQLAQVVVDRYGGALPHDRDALLDLPGIGAYTAAAVRAFAFELDAVAFDTNVRRVVHRVRFGVEFPPRATEREIDAAAIEMLLPGRSHDWNSAMMDLGATVCSARAPKCLICPLASVCAAAPLDPQRLAGLAREHAPKRGPESRLPFESTTRFARGRILDRLRALDPGAAISLLDLERDLSGVVTAGRFALGDVVGALERDGLVARDETGVRLR